MKACAKALDFAPQIHYLCTLFPKLIEIPIYETLTIQVSSAE